MDGSPGFPPLSQQIPIFKMQVDFAVQHKLPLFLHERDAFVAFVDVLREAKHATAAAGEFPVKLLVHCFNGNLAQLNCYLKDLDCFISISGTIFKNKKLQQALMQFDDRTLLLSKLMIETDSPYLPFGMCVCVCLLFFIASRCIPN